jgi:hypothetical protein
MQYIHYRYHYYKLKTNIIFLHFTWKILIHLIFYFFCYYFEYFVVCVHIDEYETVFYITYELFVY